MKKLSMDELDRKTPEGFRAAKKFPLLYVLDNVRSALNTGSVFRTADAFLLEELVLCGITATPPHREIHKTALGATDTVAWRHVDRTEMAIKELKKKGYVVLAMEQASGSISLADFYPEAGNKYAVIFGHEVRGVSHEALTLCDHCLEIPQFGTKHSMNVAVTAGIVAWDFFTKLRL